MRPTRRRRITFLSLITLQTTIATNSNTNDQFVGNTRKRKLLRGQQHNEQQYRNLQVTDEYIQTYPWYPEQHLQKCLLSSKSKPPPNWMINTGGYAELHLFATGVECCQKWFPDDDNACIQYVTQIEKEEKEQSINEELSSWVNTQQIPIENEDDDDIKPYLHDMLLPPQPQRPQVQSSNLGRPKGESSLSTLGLSVVESPEQQEQTVISLSIEEEPIIRGDKTEVLGIPPLPTPPVASPSTPSNSNVESPYTISKSQFGPLSVASETCSPSCPSGSTCVGNSASGQLIEDSECSACAEGQTWWPCDVPGLCWCHTDNTDRIAPAPPSGIPIDEQLYKDNEYYTVCDDILTKDMFETIAPNANDPYTYEGLCDAILSYNAQHTEKAFGMGNVYQRTAELAAFIGNTLHESDEYKAPREYLMCADNIVKDGEVYCKPCDPGSFDWSLKKCGHSLVSGNSDFNEYCQPQSMPPEACACGVGAGEGGELDGYVAAKHLFFGRGAIQL